MVPTRSCHAFFSLSGGEIWGAAYGHGVTIRRARTGGDRLRSLLTLSDSILHPSIQSAPHFGRSWTPSVSIFPSIDEAGMCEATPECIPPSLDPARGRTRARLAKTAFPSSFTSLGASSGACPRWQVRRVPTLALASRSKVQS